MCGPPEEGVFKDIRCVLRDKQIEQIPDDRVTISTPFLDVSFDELVQVALF
jgi:hypothetical protein